MSSKDASAVELRCDVPRDVIDTLDAVALAGALTRGQVVNRVLAAWHREQRHAATLIARVTRSNPDAAAPDGRERAT